MSKQADMMPSQNHDVTFCDKCGRNDESQPLHQRHFTHGQLCKDGTLKTVTYRRDDSTIRTANKDTI